MKYQVLDNFEMTNELFETTKYTKNDVFETPSTWKEDMDHFEGQGIRFAVPYVIMGDDNKPVSHVVKDEQGHEKREVDKSWRWVILPVVREGEKPPEPKKNPVKVKAIPA